MDATGRKIGSTTDGYTFDDRGRPIEARCASRIDPTVSTGAKVDRHRADRHRRRKLQRIYFDLPQRPVGRRHHLRRAGRKFVAQEGQPLARQAARHHARGEPGGRRRASWPWSGRRYAPGADRHRLVNRHAGVERRIGIRGLSGAAGRREGGANVWRPKPAGRLPTCTSSTTRASSTHGDPRRRGLLLGR